MQLVSMGDATCALGDAAVYGDAVFDGYAICVYDARVLVVQSVSLVCSL